MTEFLWVANPFYCRWASPLLTFSHIIDSHRSREWGIFTWRKFCHLFFGPEVVYAAVIEIKGV